MALTQAQVDCLDSVDEMINGVEDHLWPSPDDVLLEIAGSEASPKEKCEQFWFWLRQYIS